MEDNTYKAIIEAILFTMGNSVELEKISAALELEKQETKRLVEELAKDYEEADRGMRIIELDEADRKSVV